MGRRGPRPLSTPVLQALGSWRANINRDEPTPLAKAPTCPSWISTEAKRLWRELVPLMMAMRILTEADRNALARYCQTWARWKAAEQFVQKFGETYPLKDEQGRVKCFMPWPQASMAQRLSIVLTRLEQEFGLTPSARTRIDLSKCHARTDQESAELDAQLAFFRGGGPSAFRPPETYHQSDDDNDAEPDVQAG
jgi:P27 family predicted phage terminase small subunit